MKDVQLRKCETCGGQYYEELDGSRAPYTTGPRPCNCLSGLAIRVRPEMLTCKNENCGVGFLAPAQMLEAVRSGREVGAIVAQCPSCQRSYTYGSDDLPRSTTGLTA